MTSRVALPVTRGRSTIGAHSAPSRISPFIVWLRQVRRSAWVLIGLCSLFRMGDALIGPDLSAGAGFAAIAGAVQ